MMWAPFHHIQKLVEYFQKYDTQPVSYEKDVVVASDDSELRVLYINCSVIGVKCMTVPGSTVVDFFIAFNLSSIGKSCEETYALNTRLYESFFMIKI